MDVTQERLEALKKELREIYETNDGPRLLSELFAEFPNPRRVLNNSGGWGMPATCRTRPRD